MTNLRGFARSAQGIRAKTGQTPANHRQRYWFFIHYLTDVQITQNRVKPDSGLELGEDEASKCRRLEAVLLISGESQSSRKLAQLAGLADATEARTLIRRLNQAYDQSGRSFRVEEVAGGYALLTRSQFATWLRRLSHIPGESKLSQSSMETLAIVAYRQPVLRAEVEAIRGVGCSEVLKQLMELDLVRISGRSEDLGRPYLYGTTRRFLQMFGLRSADRLPRVAWVNEHQIALSSPEIAASDSQIKESIVTMSLSAAALLEKDVVASVQYQQPHSLTLSSDEDDVDFIEDDDEDDDDDLDDDDVDDDEDDDDEDEEWDDEETESADEEAADEDEIEEESEWEEVDDDDDGWEDEDEDEDEEDEDEDDDDDDWEEEDDDEEWD